MFTVLSAVSNYCQRRHILSLGVIFLITLLSARGLDAEPLNASQQLTFYVAPQGADSNTGTKDRPFGTLERVRDEIRALKTNAQIPKGGVVVEISAGTYVRTAPFELSAENSGTEEGPIVYRARQGEAVHLLGGVVVNGWKPVTDRAILSCLEEKARGKVQQTDLRITGVTDLGEINRDRLEVFYQSQPMTLARWPNEGFIKIVGLVEPDTVEHLRNKGSKAGKFMYEGDRPKRWVREQDPWVFGYWFWDWADQYHRITFIDPGRRVIEVAPPYHYYGYRVGQWFYGLNLLSELDQPGEWYLDRTKAILYFWPPAPLQDGAVTVSVIPEMVKMKDVAHVTLRGLTIEAVRGTAVQISGGSHCRIEACEIRNVGGNAIEIKGGRQHEVADCNLHALGESGIILQGGSRNNLQPAHHVAQNNHIHDYGRWQRMDTRAVFLNGVGNRVAHNLIHNAPNQGIYFNGNDHIIEFNEIHDVCLESNDAGAIYAGRDWTMRGTIIRYNYIHHINGFQQRSAVGIYLDDMFCGIKIFGNIFFNVKNATFIGGGRDCSIENNIFVNCQPAVHVDARALDYAHYHTDAWLKEARERGTLLGIHFDQPPFSLRYPKLASILKEEPAAPRGNIISRNICAGGKWADIDNRALPLLEIKDNIISEALHFVKRPQQGPTNITVEDFQLPADSPAWKIGFQPIPVDRIGLHHQGHGFDAAHSSQ